MGGRFGNRGVGESTQLERARALAERNALVLRLATDPYVVAGDLTEAARRVTRATAGQLAAERVSVWMLSGDRRELALVDLFERSQERHSAETVLHARDYPSYFAALADGRAIDAHRARTDPRTREFTDGYLTPLGIQSMLDAAIRQAGRVVGVVCVEHVADSPRRWRPDEITLASEVADVVGQTLANRDRRQADDEIRTLNAELERRVAVRTAELEAANRELEAFSYSVSHDLRAPLRHLSGFASILLEEHAGQLDEPGRDYLRRIDRASQRMQALIDGLLALSRFGRSQLRFDDIDSAREIASVWRELAGQRPLDRYRLEVAELPSCRGDAALLRQVWLNLLDNATKYSAPRDQPVISITGERTAEAVWFHVTDNGVGFDARHAGKLFGVFERVHPERDFPGIGIGLALVKRIIDRHGGEVAAEARDPGATFSFSLPVGPDPAAA